MQEERPDIASVHTGAELKRWYWLKTEIQQAARAVAVSTAGSKAEIADRLAHYLDTGERMKPVRRQPPGKSGCFDWANADLSLDTIITDTYRNNSNVRRFMEQHYEGRFRFNIAFMEWMKANTGKTLRDALEARRAIAEREKVAKPPIPSGNQYNAYTRAFFDANPHLKQKDARACWAWKRSQPGHNHYGAGDLAILKDG